MTHKNTLGLYGLAHFLPINELFILKERSGSVLHMRSRSRWFEPHRWNFVVVLNETHYHLLSTGSNLETSRHDIKIVDWDVKHQFNKEENNFPFITFEVLDLSIFHYKGSLVEISVHIHYLNMFFFFIISANEDNKGILRSLASHSGSRCMLRSLLSDTRHKCTVIWWQLNCLGILV